MVNGNFRLSNAFGILPRRSKSRRLRRGDHVRRCDPRPGQAETGVVVKINPVGVYRVQVHWTDGRLSNVKASSLIRIS